MVTFGSHVGNHQFQPFLSGVYAGVIFLSQLHAWACIHLASILHPSCIHLASILHPSCIHLHRHLMTWQSYSFWTNAHHISSIASISSYNYLHFFAWYCFTFFGLLEAGGQVKVADALKKRAPETKPDFFINVGDNFYWGGVNTVT